MKKVSEHVQIKEAKTKRFAWGGATEPQYDVFEVQGEKEIHSVIFRALSGHGILICTERGAYFLQPVSA